MQSNQSEQNIYLALYSDWESYPSSIATLLKQAKSLGHYQTPQLFSFYEYHDHSEALRGGRQSGGIEVYAVDLVMLKHLDDYFRYPTVHDRIRCEIPQLGSIWLYVMSEGYATLAGVYDCPLRSAQFA